MAKISLEDIASGYASTALLNDNFELIADALNNDVLYRDNPVGEANQMSNQLDMNSNRITNLGDAILASDAVNFRQLTSVTASGGSIDAEFVTYTPADTNYPSTNVKVRLDSLAASGGSDLVGYGNRTLTAKLGDKVSVKDHPFNAVGDGVTDDTAAIQACIDYVQSLPQTVGGFGYEWVYTVHVPAGRYVVTAEIVIDPAVSITIAGDGKLATVFDCSTGGSFRSLFYAGAAASVYTEYKDFAVFGNYKLQYGLYIPQATHLHVTEVRVSGTTVAAILASNGYSNAFLNCDIVNNSGHGLFMEGNVNGVTITACQIYSNTGFGIWVTQGLSVKIIGGVIEKNLAGGIMANLIRSLYISTYFEDCGSTGYTYTTPALTVKACVVINASGSPTTNLGAGTGMEAVVFNSCYASVLTNDCVIFQAGGRGVNINGFYLNDTSIVGTIPFIKTYNNASYSYPKDTQVKNVKSLTNKITPIEVVDVITATPVVSSWADTHAYSSIPTVNIGDTVNPDAWTLLTAAGGALTITAATQKLNGLPLFSCVKTPAGNTDIYGFTFPLSDMSDYASGWFYVVFKVKAVVGTPGINFWVDNGAGSLISTVSTGGALAANVWTKRGAIFKGNGTGTVKIGVRMTGGAASDEVLFTIPVVAPIGVPATFFGIVD